MKPTPTIAIDGTILNPPNSGAKSFAKLEGKDENVMSIFIKNLQNIYFRELTHNFTNENLLELEIIFQKNDVMNKCYLL